MWWLMPWYYGCQGLLPFRTIHYFLNSYLQDGLVQGAFSPWPLVVGLAAPVVAGIEVDMILSLLCSIARGRCGHRNRTFNEGNQT